MTIIITWPFGVLLETQKFTTPKLEAILKRDEKSVTIEFFGGDSLPFSEVLARFADISIDVRCWEW